jgi:hypothetical protein
MPKPLSSFTIEAPAVEERPSVAAESTKGTPISFFQEDKYQALKPPVLNLPKSSVIDGSREAVLRSLAKVESAGNYSAKNPASSAVGKYQFLWSKWGPKVEAYAGRPVSVEEFVKNPKLQEDFARNYYDTVLVKESSNLFQKNRDALRGRGVTSQQEAMALVHFLGYGNAENWARTGTIPSEAKKGNVSVDEYLTKFRKGLGSY